MNTMSRLLTINCTIFCLLVLSFSVSAEDRTITLETADGPIEIPLKASTSLELLATGQLRATAKDDFVCSACDDVQVSMAPVDGGSFSVSPDPVSENGDVTFTWNSKGAWNCEGGNLAGTDWQDYAGGPEGSASISVAGLSTEEVHKPSIKCCNGPNCDSVSTTFEVDKEAEAEPVPEGCSGRTPAGMNRAVSHCDWDNQGSADCQSWKGFFGREFGSTKSTQTNFYQRPNEYLALKFNSGDYPLDVYGRFSTETPQYGVETGELLWTISKCPGDFDAKAIASEMENTCYRTGDASEVMWWQGENVNYSSMCTLKQNSTYYLNILYTDSEAGTAPDKLNWACAGDPEQTCGRAITIKDQ
ncbi:MULTISPECIES: hypothetical protein [unclassified Wenzhouxiangella]|uniref:hypothetical protein n=1 Tax=unclassified Wenzhouxiangella TaxID=2613841 RepID=UPI0011C04F40|nr:MULTISPECIES: hypothetical protein [unclassified Wenzhouxiangella]